MRIEDDKKLSNFSKRKKIEGPKILTKSSIKNDIFQSLVFLDSKDAYKIFTGSMKMLPKGYTVKVAPIIINLEKVDQQYKFSENSFTNDDIDNIHAIKSLSNY